MTIAEIEQLIRLLKTSGVKSFKSKDIKLEFEPMNALAARAPDSTNKPAPPLQAIPPVTEEIIHHANEVASLLRLNDEDLVDKLFPDYTQEAQ